MLYLAVIMGGRANLKALCNKGKSPHIEIEA